jgi:hypothetical protein
MVAESMAGGFGMDMARLNAFNQCMNERGWEDRRRPFGPRSPAAQ